MGGPIGGREGTTLNFGERSRRGPIIWISQGGHRGCGSLQGAAAQKQKSLWEHNGLRTEREVWAGVERAVIGWVGSGAVVVSTDDRGIKGARPRAVSPGSSSGRWLLFFFCFCVVRFC